MSLGSFFSAVLSMKSMKRMKEIQEIEFLRNENKQLRSLLEQSDKDLDWERSRVDSLAFNIKKINEELEIHKCAREYAEKQMLATVEMVCKTATFPPSPVIVGGEDSGLSKGAKT